MLRSALLNFACLASSLLSLPAQQPDAPPVDPQATPEARALLHELDTLSGHATLSGQHNYPNTVSRYSDRVLELTGSYPAIFGQDFGFSAGEDKDSTVGRASMIQEVTRQYRKGAVIALTWHAVRPTDDEPVTFHDSVQNHLTDWEWQQLLTPGTPLHARWERQVDRIAGYLRELQNAGVPVLFRPYHEMNGNWFWWGGRPGPQGSQELYRQLFDRFVHRDQLHNLVWVWNVNAPSVNAGPVDRYFPGPNFADVVTLDVYGAFEQRYYTDMLTLAGPHKPIALAEVGTMPTLAVLEHQPRWAYFMMWSGSAEDSNTPAQLQTMLHASNIVERGDPRLGALPTAKPDSPNPVDVDATPATHALLTQLAGMRFDPSATTPTTADSLNQLTLDGNKPEILAQQLRAAEDAGKPVVLRWTPSSPTGAGQRPLTDFEWAEILRPDSPLRNAWLAEISQLIQALKSPAPKQLALALDPLPDANTNTFWWGDRPGPDGSQALLRDLHAAVERAGIHNLLWAWESALPAARVQPHTTALADVFPGPLLVDLALINGADPHKLHGYPGYLLLNTSSTKPVLLAGPPAPQQSER